MVDAQICGAGQFRQGGRPDGSIFQAGGDHVVDTSAGSASEATSERPGRLVIGMVEQAGRDAMDTRFQEE